MKITNGRIRDAPDGDIRIVGTRNTEDSVQKQEMELKTRAGELTHILDTNIV